MGYNGMECSQTSLTVQTPIFDPCTPYFTASAALPPKISQGVAASLTPHQSTLHLAEPAPQELFLLLPWLSPFSALHKDVESTSFPKSSSLPGSAASSPRSFGEKDVDIPYEHYNAVPSRVFPVPLDITLLLNPPSAHSKSSVALHFPQAFQGGLLGSELCPAVLRNKQL